MFAEDLRPEEIIRINQQGLPAFGSQRLIFTGVTTLHRFGKDLQSIMGRKTSAMVMMRLGYDTGLAGAMGLADMYAFDSPEEWLKAFNILLPATGMALQTDTDYELDLENKTIRYSGIWKNSFEVQVWNMFHEGLSPKPVCHLLSGVISGYLTAILGKDVMAHELSCRAQGHKYCTFEALPMDEWGEDPSKIHKPLKADWVNEEIERLKYEIKRSRQAIDKQKLELNQLKSNPADHRQHKIVYRSTQMGQVVNLAATAAPSDSNILIQGESGTGKELVARFIHQTSNRVDHPFLAINCAAIPSNLIESEFFGYMKGAFTDAKTDREGLLVQAGQGTIFMDEVSELPFDVQAKLLRVLQQKEVRPLGSAHEVPIQARIIAATNQDLLQMVKKRTFRQDLYYRLAVFPLLIPPLRQRREDILILARHFLSRLDPDHPGFTPEVVKRMQTYNWPGNIRELENCVEYAFILARDTLVSPEHLPLSMAAGPTNSFGSLILDFPNPKELVKRYARQMVAHTGGDKSEAARLMGVSTTTLWRYLK